MPLDLQEKNRIRFRRGLSYLSRIVLWLGRSPHRWKPQVISNSEVQSAIIEARVQNQIGFARYLDRDKKREGGR